MEQVKAIVLRAAGINCDLETEHALRLAGAEPQRIHINRLMAEPTLLDGVHILVFPGGFSYGDDVAAGKILANQVVHHLSDLLHRFVEQGKLILGICNGFQVLIKTGLAPALNGDAQTSAADYPVTLTDNDSGRFEDRWVYLQPGSPRCVFIDPARRIYLPVAHGEGKIVARNAATLARLADEGYAAFRYVDAEGRPGPFPVNPNGSQDDIAALTDSTGRVLGMMPHPERFVRLTQHPHWTRLKEREGFGDGMTIFNNAVRYIREHF
ncbi:MAG TPA: phosphoribosylformylglycinamidine synthase I [Phycisphaerales bacterium]|mgnify:CR=1 FL=1|nr:phosphoribosylformylglycinamidine synthase I [Phycisphaerales bacterium]